MLIRLNQAESYWHRPEAGRELATPGPDRVRVRELETLEFMLALAWTSMTALTLPTNGARVWCPSPPSPCRTAASATANLCGGESAIALGRNLRLPSRLLGEAQKVADSQDFCEIRSCNRTRNQPPPYLIWS